MGDRDLRRMVLRVVALYTLFGALWIVVSDPLLAFFVRDLELLTRLNVLKGWTYVVLTAGLLYLLLKRETHIWRIERAARMEAEISLRASEERFHSIYDSVSDAVFIHEMKTGRIMDVNNRMCEMYRCTKDQARASIVDELSLGEPPFSEKEALAYLKSAAGGEPQVFTWHCRRMDRSLFWGEVRMRRARVGQEDVIIVSVSDISARMATELALTESNERFRQLAENIDEVFWMLSTEDGKMLYVSPAYEKIWGRSCESIYENPGSWADAIVPEDRDRVLKAVANRDGSTYAETYRITRPDGQVRWIYDRAFPVKNVAGKVYRIVGITTDITERRTLELQFSHAQKMEAIGTLAGGIAHDFNNILGAITGYAELARLDAREPSVQGSLTEIFSACKRAGDLVRQILAFSRQQEHKRVPLQLERVVQEAAKLLRAVLPSSLGFELKLDRKTPTVLADPTQIHQIVMNLCTNAAHAMEGRTHSHLKIELDRFEADETFAKLHRGGRPGVYTCLTVSDNGQGMDRLTLERIYEPFFTTKAPGKGTGLGLAVVHGIVQRHDGLITVESSPGQGTTFRLYFPEYALSDSPELPVELPAVQGRGQRILVIDDEEVLVRMIGRILTKLGYAPSPLQDPVAALAAFETAPDKFDLVLSDLTMPGLTGIEFAAQINRIKPGIPIILMTGFYANLDETQLKAAGVTEIIMKPVDVKSLSVVIDQVLKKKKLT
ncbi:MAG: PAS domain S-box protein [Nibricoccus sp.]